MQNRFHSKFSRNLSQLKFSDENLSQSPDWTILTSQFTLIDDKLDLNQNQNNAEYFPSSILIKQTSEVVEETKQEQDVQKLNEDQDENNKFQYQSEVVHQINNNEAQQSQLLVSEVFQYPQLHFENYVEPIQEVRVPTTPQQSKIADKIVVSVIQEHQSQQENQIKQVQEKPQSIDDDKKVSGEEDRQEEEKDQNNEQQKVIYKSEFVIPVQNEQDKIEVSFRRQAIDNSGQPQNIHRETVQISTFKNNALEFMIVNEDSQINVDSIKTYSTEELESAINQAEILITKENYLNFQATIWTKSIPINIIRKLWIKLINIKALKNKHQDFNYSEKRFIYDMKSRHYVDIMKDLHRTFGHDDSFVEAIKWQESLKNILVAYSNIDPEVGYTQGMNYIIGTLLVLFNPSYGNQNEADDYKISTEDEEQAFWIFVYLMTDPERQWRVYYMKGVPGIFTVMPRLEQRLIHSCPLVYEYLKNTGVFNFSIIFSQYFHTIMTQFALWEFSSIIFTLLLIDGAPFFLQLITSLCIYSQQTILQLKDLEAIIGFFRQNFVNDFHQKLRLVESEKEIIQILLNIGLLNGEHFSMIENTNQDKIVEKPQEKNVLNKNFFNKIQNLFSRMRTQ